MLFSPRPFLKSGDTDNSCIRFAATGLKFHLTLEREEKNLAFVKFEHIYKKPISIQAVQKIYFISMV